ncbi:Severe Depolymerization of Actin [Steccherinum ochraceum]|uniref:Protein SDA1 n=1 Tax=Steccherinum ochraceum TaxID=92696 RepID=A0A4R0RNN1_9APHY|nr:Severe Depolymerization of Actin [Steccherinum ochraceum]
MGRGVLLTANLPQLQNLIKRDPPAYQEEFLQQWNHYNSIREIFKTNPDEQAQHFRELITFISQVAQCYPKHTKDFPSHISSMLLENYGSLSPDTRKTLVQNLVMLRNKGVISSIELLKSLFPLLPRTTSSSLRSFIRKTILSDIRTANMRSKNHKLNRAVQTMLFGMIEKGMDIEVVGDKGKAKAVNTGNHESDDAMWAVVLTKELWKKGVWSDAKTVSIVALGCSHPVIKVQSASIHFFLGEDDDGDDSDEEEAVDVKGLQHRHEINKKTRSGEKKLEKQVKVAKAKRKRKNEITSANFPALQLLNDPQTFSEKLYDMLNKYDKRYSLDHKILIMQLLSRVMGAHKLHVLSFYTYIMKYLTYHQLRIPAILVALAQSVHDFTPPDALLPCVRKLAQEFVHPGVGSEVVAAGINAIREVCRRQPWAMEEDLLGDLVEYRKSRDKAVTAAARGLLQLFRDENPAMLKRRERGKEASMGLTAGARQYGHSTEAAVDIEGLVLLEDHLKRLREEDGAEEGDMDDDDEAGWENWDVESDSSDESSSDGWMDVDSDGDDDLEVSDSDDDEDTKSKKEEGKGKEMDVDEKEDNEDEEDAPTLLDPSRVSVLATTKILTPADFAMLNDLKLQAAKESVEKGGGKATKRKLAALEAEKKARSQSGNMDDAFISEMDILGPRKKAKSDYAERMASIEKGREGREKFGSLKGKKNKAAPSSSTNKEKARNKPLMMVIASGAVRSKKKASLRDKQKKLRAHIDKAKKTKH